MFQSQCLPRRVGFRMVLVASAVSALVWNAGAAVAHEGHAALPSKGATVSGDLLLLSGPALKGIGVKTAKVKLGDLNHVLRVNARAVLPSSQEALVTTLVPGKIERVLVKPGETVAAGQELAHIQSLELETLQLQMLQEAGELELARQLVRQRSRLAQSQIIEGASLLEAERDLEQRTAELAITQRKLRALGLVAAVLEEVLSTRQPTRTLAIRSPRAGVVVHADVRVGESVEPTQHLFNIVDTSKLMVIGNVLETDLSLVAPGQTVVATFQGVTDHSFNAQIDQLSVDVDEAKRTVEALVYIENGDALLRPGLFGRMEIQVKTSQGAIVCPTAALIENGPTNFVLLQQGEGKFLRRRVKLGLRTTMQVEILDGLFPGDQVIVVGNHVLAALFGEDVSGKPKKPGQSTPSATSRRDNAAPLGEKPSIVVADAVVELPTSQKVFATSAIDGRIARIFVMPGQQVTKGEVLAEVESLELRRLQLELFQAHVRLRWTEGAIERLEKLKGLTAAKEIWPLQSQRVRLRSTIESLVRKLSLVGLTTEQIDRLRRDDLTASLQEDPLVATIPIRAPAAGRVTRFDVVPGEVIQPRDKPFEVHDTSLVWVRGHLFEQDQSRVRVGQAAIVTLPSYPDLRLEGTVVRAAPILDEAERVLPVWVEVANPKGVLRQGMLARVEINAKGSAGSVAARRPSQ